MRSISNFIVPATNGTYTSPSYNVNSLANFNYYISFEFYNDEQLTEPSTGMTGTLTINGKFSENSVWQNLPDTSTPSTVDAADAKTIGFNGVVYELQVVTNAVTNTNFIKIIIDHNLSA